MRKRDHVNCSDRLILAEPAEPEPEPGAIVEAEIELSLNLNSF